MSYRDGLNGIHNLYLNMHSELSHLRPIDIQFKSLLNLQSYLEAIASDQETPDALLGLAEHIRDNLEIHLNAIRNRARNLLGTVMDESSMQLSDSQLLANLQEKRLSDNQKMEIDANFSLHKSINAIVTFAIAEGMLK